MACVFELLIQHVFHALPNGKTIGLDHHAAFDIAVLREIGLHDQFIVPLAVIRFAGSQF